MRIIWTETALSQRTEILDYIAADDPDAAIALDERFRDVAAQLTDFPQSGRMGRIPGTREIFPHPHYRLVYEIDGDAVWILTLIHTARQWPGRSDRE